MRKSHSRDFKFKVALEAIKGDLTIAQISSKYGVAPSCIHKWKNQLLGGGAVVFDGKTPSELSQQEVDKLHATIGRLKVENDFFERALSKLPGGRG
jgi:transposase-like protein